MADQDATWDALAGDLVHAMLVVTVRHDDEKAGCLVGFATQVSIDPPRFLVCLSERNRTYALARDAAHLGVHVVPEGRKDLAELFGGETGDDVDKFARCAWVEGPEGVPVLEACGNRFVGRVLDRVPFGDHVGHVLEPVAAQHAPGARQLLSTQVLDVDAGHDA